MLRWGVPRGADGSVAYTSGRDAIDSRHLAVKLVSTSTPFVVEGPSASFLSALL